MSDITLLHILYNMLNLIGEAASHYQVVQDISVTYLADTYEYRSRLPTDLSYFYLLRLRRA